MTTPATEPVNIVISVDREANIYWNGERVRDEDELLARLVTQSTTTPREVPSPSANVVILEILGDGTFVWNGERVPDAETLDSHWKALAAEQPQPQIRIRPNREAKYESVRRALEGAQRNGVTKLGFVGNVGPSPSQP